MCNNTDLLNERRWVESIGWLTSLAIWSSAWSSADDLAAIRLRPPTPSMARSYRRGQHQHQTWTMHKKKNTSHGTAQHTLTETYLDWSLYRFLNASVFFFLDTYLCWTFGFGQISKNSQPKCSLFDYFCFLRFSSPSYLTNATLL